MSPTLEAAAPGQDMVRAAEGALEEATKRRDAVQAEKDALAAKLAGEEERLRALTGGGDPSGKVREVSKRVRMLHGDMEDLEADLQAQENAVDGARKARARARLAAIPEQWAAHDTEGVGARVRGALTELAAALDDLAALESEYGGLVDLSRALVSSHLNNEVQGPHLPPPDCGIRRPDLMGLRHAVASAVAQLPKH